MGNYVEKFKKAEEEYLKAKAEYDAAAKAESEQKKQKLAEERKERAKEIENAYAKVIEAQKNYSELRSKFVKDYGSYHMTFSNTDDSFFNSIFDNFFKVM